MGKRDSSKNDIKNNNALRITLLSVVLILSMVFLMGATSKKPDNQPVPGATRTAMALSTLIPTPTEQIQSIEEATYETNGIILAGVLLLMIILLGTIGATRNRPK